MMRYSKPLKQVLTATKNYWDQPGTRPAVRHAFGQLLKCGTLALGAEVFASDNERKVVPHTCKARPCPSCGHRATIAWQREQWCALPDVRHAGIVFTMPNVLWTIFQENRHLLRDLPKLGATVIQNWARRRWGVSVSIMVIPHTFGAKLNFNTHLHILVSVGGLRQVDCIWTEISFDRDKLMHMWRYAMISYFRAAFLLASSVQISIPAGLEHSLNSSMSAGGSLMLTFSNQKAISCAMPADTSDARRSPNIES